MTAIEHQELKGITIKNLVLTVVSTASIVASVMTTYFNLRSDIMEIRSSQQAEAKINNIRIKVLEDEVAVLQKEVDKIKFLNADYVPAANHLSSPRPASAALLSSIKK
jgi:ethanolamine utilization cobalamin adenosyltransferase